MTEFQKYMLILMIALQGLAMGIAIGTSGLTNPFIPISILYIFIVGYWVSGQEDKGVSS